MFYLRGAEHSVVQREGIKVRNGGIKLRKRANHDILCLPTGSQGLATAKTISWTCTELKIFKCEFWSVLLSAAFTEISSRLVFVLRIKRNTPLLGDVNPN